MREFIKENEKLFLDYINFKNASELEITTIKDELTMLKSQIIANNLKVGSEPFKEIEEKRDKIMQINEEITKYGIGKNANSIKEQIGSQSKSETIKNDFDLDVDIGKLLIEKANLEDELKELLDACKENSQNALTFTRIEELEKKQKELKEQSIEKEEKIYELLDKNINSKKDISANIESRQNAKIIKLEDEITELTIAMNEINEVNFEEEELKLLKENTIARLEKEIEDKKEEIRESSIEVRDIKQGIRNEIIGLEELRESLQNNTLRTTVYKALEMNEEEIIEENIEDLEIEDIEYEDKLEIKEETEVEEKSLIEKVKSKVLGFFGKVKKEFIDMREALLEKEETIEENVAETIEQEDVVEEVKEEPKSFIDRIKVEVNKEQTEEKEEIHYEGKSVEEINEIVK